MIDYINKVVSIFMIFVELVLAPLLINYVATEGINNRLVLNEVTQFIDKVTDKGSVTQYDIDDLYLGVNSCGGVFTVKVERYVRAATEDTMGKIKTLYFSNDDLSYLNVGDVVKVTVEHYLLLKGCYGHIKN